MATIKCGHCIFIHASVAEVRECWEAHNAPEPREVCCFSCDGLIGYDLPDRTDGARDGCGGPDICRRDFPASF